MKITKLEYQKKDPNRVNIYVDEKFAVGISVDGVLKLGLFKNQEISTDFLNQIISQSNFGKGLNLALNFLSFRPRSEFEIRQHLKRKKIDEIEKIIIKLKEIGQVDDKAFTDWFVEQRKTFRPKGRRALEFELAKKGVKTKIENINERELALKAFKKYHGKDDLTKKQRYLASRGFGWDVIEEVLKKGYNKDNL